MLIELNQVAIAVAEKTLLEDVTLHVSEGEFVYLIGHVGSGKSSLLKTLYGELPVQGLGEAKILDFDLYQLKRKHLPNLRKQLGIIFQDFQLMSDRTVYDNIDFVLRATGWKKKALRQQRIMEVLSEVELTDKAQSVPHQLSGGEQHRISIARALINKPQIILADEPTGNLDSENGAKIVSLLRRVCERGTAVVMVTHNLNVLTQFPGIIYKCENGHVSEVTTEFNTPINMTNDAV